MLSLNEMWREPEDRVTRRKHVSHIAPKDRIVYMGVKIQDYNNNLSRKLYDNKHDILPYTVV